MSGSSILGAILVGTGEILSGTVSGDVSYNGYEFDQDYVIIESISDLYDLGSYSFETYKRVGHDGEGFNQYNLNRKGITVRGVIKHTSAANLEALINEIKGYILQPNKTLILRKQDGTIVQTKASCTQISMPREHYHITHVPFTIKFETVDPFLYETVFTEIAYEGTTLSFSDSFSMVEGSYGYAEPYIVINFLYASSVTSVSVSIGDNTMNLTGTFAVSDQILINSAQRYCLLNGDTHAYTGQFPLLTYGSNTVEVTINGTREADIYFLYYPTYA